MLGFPDSLTDAGGDLGERSRGKIVRFPGSSPPRAKRAAAPRRARQRRSAGFVYLAKAEGLRRTRIKVGFSTHEPDGRCAQLSAGGIEHRLVSTFGHEDAWAVEQLFHKCFAPYRAVIPSRPFQREHYDAPKGMSGAEFLRLARDTLDRAILAVDAMGGRAARQRSGDIALLLRRLSEPDAPRKARRRRKRSQA